MKLKVLTAILIMFTGLSAAATSANYSSDVFKVEGICADGNASGVSDVNFSRGQNDSRIVEFRGGIESSTPCQEVNHSIEQDDGRHILNVATESANAESRTACVQCTGEVRYYAYFSSTGPFELEVRHDGQPIKILAHNETDSDNSTDTNNTSQDQGNIANNTSTDNTTTDNLSDSPEAPNGSNSTDTVENTTDNTSNDAQETPNDDTEDSENGGRVIVSPSTDSGNQDSSSTTGQNTSNQDSDDSSSASNRTTEDSSSDSTDETETRNRSNNTPETESRTANTPETEENPETDGQNDGFFIGLVKRASNWLLGLF